MKKKQFLFTITAILLVNVASAQQPNYSVEASSYTKEANEKVKRELDLNDQQDFKDATRGFIATIESPYIVSEADGSNIYDLMAWDFLDNEEAPATANPSLWRQSRLNKIHGLFEVIPNHIYQIRGFDLANITFVKSKSGWVVIDVSTSKETAKAAYDLIKQHVGDFPIKAIIITHPHADHFSGIDAIIEGAPNKYKNKIEIIAPYGYFDDAVNENMMAGDAMGRRARYMYGDLLPKHGKGSIGCGLGQTNSTGIKTLKPATKEIDTKGEILEIDGLTMEFMSVPGAEAPSEVMIYFPQLKAFCVAEEINRTMHNLYTLRGAQVRNGLLWSKYIDEALVKYGDEVEISFSTHHWPTWGNENIVNYWEKQRDMYRYLHDQTLHLANKGYTSREIAEMVTLPESISSEFANREYYGTTSHNVKAQYQLYFGWFDGVPANLNPLPPVDESKKYIEAFGEQAVFDRAKEAFDKGEYRWCATLANKLIFANPKNDKGRMLLAEAYSQMGYQAESGPWRNFYLQGAKELVEGVDKTTKKLSDNKESTNNLRPDQLFDILAIQINGDKTAGKSIIININFTDTKETSTLILSNGALTNRTGVLASNPTLTISGNKNAIYTLFLEPQNFKTSIGSVVVNGDQNSILSIFQSMDSSDPYFNIVEP